jgi:murein DD-endopeptidase MepM/ murein hydrolase activator NlpD
MTTRRSTLRRVGQGLRRVLVTALHLRPRRPAAPSRVAAPAMLASVTAMVGLAVASGQAAAARPATATRPAAATSALAPANGSLASPADVALVMRAVEGPSRSGTDGIDAAASRSSQRAPLHRWVRPNYGPMSSPFGSRWGRPHEGIDLAGPYGSPILAATDGCISYAGPEDGYGEVMKITDWDGTETLYGHMSAFVKTSGCVKAGQEIARVGSAGDATGAHLHFEVHVGGTPVDPVPFLAERGVYI